MGKLILIRHGNTNNLDNHPEFKPRLRLSSRRQKGLETLFWRSPNNLLETPLNETGIHQAERTADYLGQFTIGEIRSSTALRAVHTAIIISNRLGIPFSSKYSDPSLTERMNFGDNLAQRWKRFKKEWERLDEAETNVPRHPYLGDSTKRSGEKMRDYLQMLPQIEGNIVVVSHGGKIRDFANQLIVAGDFEPGMSLRKPDEQGRETKGLANCSLTVVRREGEKFILESLGTTAHLENSIENGLPKRTSGGSKER